LDNGYFELGQSNLRASATGSKSPVAREVSQAQLPLSYFKNADRQLIAGEASARDGSLRNPMAGEAQIDNRAKALCTHALLLWPST
jgi:hypothetical protein